MDRQEVIERLCAISSNVGSIVYKDELPHDCFCQDWDNFQFDSRILDFIWEAVNDKIKEIKLKEQLW